jgi:GT2 family glycosyltransferase
MITWHGRHALAQSLPALARAVQKHGGNHEIILVIDYESSDGTEEYVRRNFPQARVIVADHPLYFSAATRLGINSATRDIVLLINNDTVVDEDFLSPLLDGFVDSNVFGVASRVSDSATQDPETGKTVVQRKYGSLLWKHLPVTSDDAESRYRPVSWLHRGAFALDRHKYHWMRGLDDLYDPLYFEDADLSFRAWKIGWKCLLAANSRVTHQHRLELPAAGNNFLRMITRRNAYIFYWKNITEFRWIAQHFWTATWRHARNKSDRADVVLELHALAGALRRLPRLLKRRLTLARMSVVKDRQVFENITFASPTPEPATKANIEAI